MCFVIELETDGAPQMPGKRRDITRTLRSVDGCRMLHVEKLLPGIQSCKLAEALRVMDRGRVLNCTGTQVGIKNARTTSRCAERAWHFRDHGELRKAAPMPDGRFV